MPNQRYQKVDSSNQEGSSNSDRRNDNMNIDKENDFSESENRRRVLPSTDSLHHLIQSGENESVTTNHNINPLVPNDEASFSSISAKNWFIIGVLCFVNLINYMDRYTVAGVLDEIQDHFKLSDDQGGLLQTAFILSYMVCAPVFGYLGDRYSRRFIMILGVFLWSGTTLLGSYMNHFGWFLAFRAMVGIGEASYSTIAPTIISDLFVHNLRSKMLMLFYFAIPVGSGLGYIIGSETANALGTWRWALRVTPILGAIAVVLIYFIKDPERGQSEGTGNMEITSYREDLKDVTRNKSFMLSTVGFTCVAFVAGALAWWGPKFIYFGLKLQENGGHVNPSDVSYKFGIIAMLSGLIGVPTGSLLAQRLRPHYANIDPHICAGGLFISAPFVYFALVVAKHSTDWCFFFVFMAEVSLNLCWSIVADIVLYVIIPTRRGTATAFQILVSHAFGDAGSPYLVGVISEAIKALLRDRIIIDSIATSPNSETDLIQFKSLQYALMITAFIEVFGGVMFLLTGFFIIRDKTRTKDIVAHLQREPHNLNADEILDYHP